MASARTVVRLCAAMMALMIFAPPTLAQFGPPGGQQGQPGGNLPPVKKPEKKKRERSTVPLPEPLDDEVEKARERAKEPGVLLGKTPKKNHIFEIRVTGARKIEADAVLVYIHSRVDARPDKRIIQGDVRRIYRMGLFRDVIVSTTEGKNGSVTLHYTLQEKPAIGDVVIEDNDAVGDDDIKEVLDLKAFQVLDIPRVRRNADKIQKLYVDKGYFLAEVTYKFVPSDGPSNPDGDDETNLIDSVVGFLRDEGLWAFDNFGNSDDDKASATGEGLGEFVNVVFTVVEQDKVKVHDVRFVGADEMSPERLANGIGTREDHPFGLVTDWGTYKEEMAELDPLAAEAVYQDEGYINVRVGKPRISLSPDKTRLTLSMPIQEGEQYTLSSIDLVGDLLIEDPDEFDRIRDEDDERVVFLKSDILAEAKIRPGELFARSKIATDVLAIAERYRDRGYAYVKIDPGTEVDPEEKSLAVKLRVNAGPRVKIERVDIVGNSKTQDRVIRRELRVYEGEWYSASLLKQSEQRVTALGFFENVSVTSRQGSRPDRMVVVFEVTEKSTGTFQVGAGFSNAEQFILTGQISQNNFLGRGVTLSGSVQLSAFRQIVDMRYIDPYAFYVPVFGNYEPVTLAFSVFNTQRNFIQFVRSSLGSDVTLGYPLGRPLKPLYQPVIERTPNALKPYVPDPENLQVFATVNGERVEIQEGTFDVNLFGLRAHIPRYTSSVRGSMIFDQRNNRLFPSQGYYLQLAGEWAHPFMGSALAPPAETLLHDAIAGTGFRDNIGPIRPGFFKPGGIANLFGRYTMNLRLYYSFNDWLPIDGVVLKGNFELGYLATADNSLVFERFYLGGFNTIRGYFPRSIGPVQRVGGPLPDGQLNAFRIGGTKQMYANIELEFPIFEQVGIRGVAFVDLGNTYADDENPFYLGNGPTPYLQTVTCGGKRCWDARDRRDLPLGVYTSVGLGVRWFSPIGPLRFEWGVPLSPRPVGTFGFEQGDQPIQFEFNIGQSF